MADNSNLRITYILVKFQCLMPKKKMSTSNEPGLPISYHSNNTYGAPDLIPVKTFFVTIMKFNRLVLQIYKVM